MLNPFTDPPKLLLKALEDIGAIADVARRVPELEAQLEGVVEQVSEDLGAVRGGLERLEGQVGAINAKLDGLREELAPIQLLPTLRTDVQPLGGKMDVLREHVDDIEPMFRQVTDAIHELVPKIAEVRDSVAPVADVIDNLPKFMKN